MWYLLLGLVVGIAVSYVIFNLDTDGTLRVDHSNPEKDSYLFEIDNLDRINKKKRIKLKVDNNADLSPK